MSNFRTGIKLAIIALVEATSAAIQTVYTSEKANRIDWRQLVQTAEQGGTGLNLPFIVILFEKMGSATYGASNDAYEWPITVYYVISTVGLTTTQLETSIDNAGQMIRAAIQAYTGTLWTLQNNAVEIDDSPMMEANQLFHTYNHQMQAVSIRFTLICGETR